MKKEVVSFEIAKLAKEKGFDVVSNLMYAENKQLETYNETRAIIYGDYYHAPTQDLLQKWLREKHKVHITVDYIPDQERYFCYVFKTWNQKIDIELDRLNGELQPHFTYEEALEVGLYRALESI